MVKDFSDLAHLESVSSEKLYIFDYRCKWIVLKGLNENNRA